MKTLLKIKVLFVVSVPFSITLLMCIRLDILEGDIPIIPGNTPIILTWNAFWGDKNWYKPTGTDAFHKNQCPVLCYLTNDHRLFDNASTILIHPGDHIAPFPRQLKPWQRSVMYYMESPKSCIDCLVSGLNGKFNWTMTYRLDSDVYAPYYKFSKTNSSASTRKKQQTMPVKTKLVYWLVSHCDTESRRERYVRNLAEYIQVDIFGKCGESGKKSSASHDPEDYKFYLSFENSLCLDYSTEKVARAYLKGNIPILMGNAPYSTILPPNSYIDIADFDSPKKLAEYLKKLHKNDTLYKEYFAWRNMYKLDFKLDSKSYLTIGLCELCQHSYHLKRNASYKNNIYENISFWFRSTNICKYPEDNYPALAPYFSTEQTGH